jgi:hypothetical protein
VTACRECRNIAVVFLAYMLRVPVAEEREASVLEPPSLLEEPSVSEPGRPSVSMVLPPAGHAAGPGDDSLQQEVPPPLPPAAMDDPDSPPSPPQLPSRRGSSDYDNDDVDDIFNHDLPSLPDVDGDSTGGVSGDLVACAVQSFTLMLSPCPGQSMRSVGQQDMHIILLTG